MAVINSIGAINKFNAIGALQVNLITKIRNGGKVVFFKHGATDTQVKKVKLFKIFKYLLK